MTKLVPSYGLDLSRLPERERESAWRRAFGGQYAMPDLPKVFVARGRGFDLGRAVLADTSHPAFSLVREAGQARRDGVDNIFISTELSGGFHVDTSGTDEFVGPGRITLFDVSKAVTKRAQPGRTLVLAVARELIEEVLPGIDLHALTLGPAGTMLAEHLRNLRANMAAMELDAAPHLVNATVHLLAACVRPSADHVERARPVLTSALLTRAKRFIRRHCLEPGLNPETVAAAVGASRASLYRAFEPDGGVSEYIRRSRLETARFALYDPRDTRRIGEIAFACGFNSEAQFSRAMRAAFGATPSELRREQSGFRLRLVKEKWLMKGWDETGDFLAAE